jgi:hypothetical protein
MIKFVDYPSYLHRNTSQDLRVLNKILEDLKEFSKEYNIKIVLGK